MNQQQKQPTLIWKHIPGLEPITYEEQFNIWTRGSSGFVCVSLSEKKNKIEMGQFLKHPSDVVGLVPKEADVFVAGAVSGADAKIWTLLFAEHPAYTAQSRTLRKQS